MDSLPGLLLGDDFRGGCRFRLEPANPLYILHPSRDVDRQQSCQEKLAENPSVPETNRGSISHQS
jgi:hypothetical protein